MDECENEDANCKGPVQLSKDPYLLSMFDETAWVLLCRYHYAERVSDI